MATNKHLYFMECILDLLNLYTCPYIIYTNDTNRAPAKFQRGFLRYYLITGFK